MIGSSSPVDLNGEHGEEGRKERKGQLELNITPSASLPKPHRVLPSSPPSSQPPLPLSSALLSFSDPAPNPYTPQANG